MQEEKMIEQGAEGKKERQPRRHGYFIQPPAEDKKEQAPKSGTPKQNKNTGEQGEQGQNANRKKQGGNQTGNRHPRPKKSNDVRSGNTQNINPAENAASSAPQGTQGNAQGGQKKKKHKKSKSKPKSQDGSQIPAKQTQPEQKSNKSTAVDKGRRGGIKTPIDHSAEDYEEYKLTVNEESKPQSVPKKIEDENAPKTEVVGIRFKSTGKVYYFDPKGRTFKRGTGAIVDTARGQEYGEVAMPNTFVKSADIVPPLRPVIRSATTVDVEHHKSNKQKEEEAFKICNEKIAEHKLDMKLIDAQYTFDNSKLLFYFTSTNRVDFRELVKDLAGVFRTRIELRQIGIRDEAKIMGGLGMCGRPLCCTLFLSDFDQVSIKMAKEQNLSLNSAKISGICGRLMCCLKYEHEAYEYEIKRTPPVDSLVRTENGDGIVTEISPLQGTVKVRLIASPDVPPKTYKRDDVTMLRKKQNTDKK